MSGTISGNSLPIGAGDGLSDSSRSLSTLQKINWAGNGCCKQSTKGDLVELHVEED